MGNTAAKNKLEYRLQGVSSYVRGVCVIFTELGVISGCNVEDSVLIDFYIYIGLMCRLAMGNKIIIDIFSLIDLYYEVL